MRIEDNNALTTARFKIHPVPNLEQTKKQGRPIFDEIEVVEIKFAGNKQTVAVYPAHAIADRAIDQETGETIERTYAMKYNDQYRAFKSGNPQASAGTQLDSVEFMSPGKVLELKALGITTVEALAALGGANLKQLGMAGPELQRKAVEFIEKSTAERGDTYLQSRIEELEARIAQMQATNDDAVEEELSEDDQQSPFADYEADDIRNWLKEAAPDLKLDQRWGKKTLIEKADEVNRRLAEKKVA